MYKTISKYIQNKDRVKTLKNNSESAINKGGSVHKEVRDRRIIEKLLAIVHKNGQK